MSRPPAALTAAGLASYEMVDAERAVHTQLARVASTGLDSVLAQIFEFPAVAVQCSKCRTSWVVARRLDDGRVVTTLDQHGKRQPWLCPAGRCNEQTAGLDAVKATHALEWLLKRGQMRATGGRPADPVGDEDRVGQVKLAIQKHSRPRRPASLQQVADAFPVSPRTVQNWLAKHGTTYSKLLKETLS